MFPDISQNHSRGFIFIIAGYVIIYASLEITAALLGDTIKPENAFLIMLVVIVFTVFAEIVLLKNSFSQIVKFLGLGKPTLNSIALAFVISVLLFLCYPLISSVTGHQFHFPQNWPLLATGVFALHGIAEEILYRGYLFRHLRKGRSFSKAAWIAVLFFTAAHIPIIINQGLLVGGMAVLLAVVSSFPLSYLYERGGNTIWAPAIVHFAIDTIIPIMAAGGTMDQSAQFVIILWMGAAMLIPYISFLISVKNK